MQCFDQGSFVRQIAIFYQELCSLAWLNPFHKNWTMVIGFSAFYLAHRSRLISAILLLLLSLYNFLFLADTGTMATNEKVTSVVTYSKR